MTLRKPPHFLLYPHCILKLYFIRDLSGAFSENATTEEILQQARHAAREAARRLATRKPNSKVRSGLIVANMN